MDENANDFQYNVAAYFEAKGWRVNISPHYVDVLQQKTREIDIIAQKWWPVSNNFRDKHGSLCIRLVIECKWIPRSVYLNFLPKDMNLAAEIAQNNAVLHDSMLWRAESTEHPKIHHYLQGNEVAKNSAFTGEQNRDLFFQAWQQALHALLYYQHNQPSLSPYRPHRRARRFTYTIDYPVVVVNSFEKFFKRDPLTKTSSPIQDNFIFLVNYSYPVSVFSSTAQQPHAREDFFIDIVSFPTLENFLDNLEQNDGEILAEKIWQDFMESEN